MKNKYLGAKWQVQSTESTEIQEFSSVSKLRKAILDGKVLPNDKARKVNDYRGQETKYEDWKPLLETLVKSSFHIRVLFQPVWAHTVAGAGLASRMGVVIALALCVISTLADDAFGVSYWLALIASLWCMPWISKAIGKQNPGMWIGAGFLFAATMSKLIPVWQSLPVALEVQLGATIAGATIGVFPGMIVGTLVGLIRRSRIAVAPSASKEEKLIINGIVIPVLCFIGVIIAHYYFIEWFRELITKQS